MKREEPSQPMLDPADETKLMDITQQEANRAVRSLLPCDPCEECSGLDAPKEVEAPDLGVGVEDDLFEF